MSSWDQAVLKKMLNALLTQARNDGAIPVRLLVKDVLVDVFRSIRVYNSAG
ncbi:hypothetical protein [Pseudomonas boanensis]|uniref:hypothetical protein n=1 Tax=Metapseudomonas boanensis TaxID=2822138 RepID=UPI0035D44F76